MLENFSKSYFLANFFLSEFKNIGFFPIKDMQTPPLSFGPAFMDDGKYAE